ncbi:hypothetical protein, partial [Escherichia coli]
GHLSGVELVASLDIVWNSLWPLLVITATTGSAAYAMFRRKVM